MNVVSDSAYTLDQLESWPHGVNDWPADGTGLAVIGHPVSHSLSPAMHNAALRELAKTNAQFSKWRYFKFDIEPGNLPAALQEFHRLRFRGLNLTVPHKSVAIELGILTQQDSFVRDAGAANTLVYTEDGWQGTNTDGYGLSKALRQDDLGLSLAGAKIILLGAGGAARGAAVECLRAGCAGLWIGNRSKLALDGLFDDLQRLRGFSTIQKFSLAKPGNDLPQDAVVINATSLGLKVGDPAPIDLRKIDRPRCVFDMIYNPPQTALLRDAAALGLPHANGLSMLVHQGARALEIWTGANVPANVMHAAASAALA